MKEWKNCPFCGGEVTWNGTIWHKDKYKPCILDAFIPPARGYVKYDEEWFNKYWNTRDGKL